MGTIFSSEEADPPPPTRPGKQGSRPAHYPLNSLAARVSCKLEEGDFRVAIRLVCSEDYIAEVDEATLAALRSKHPPPHPNSCIPPVPEELAPTILVSKEEIAHAISSFPNGSSGEPDGLRPQHLKNLISTSAERGGRELLRALTSFVNLVLDGKTPPSARPFFFGATLIPLGKKGGGIRPIAVGHTLRRLVAKCASSVILPSLGNLLAPLQLGCGTPMGCEAVVHAARQFVHNLIPGQMLLKLDFKNTFNYLRRDKMLMSKGIHTRAVPIRTLCVCTDILPLLHRPGCRVLQRCAAGRPLGPHAVLPDHSPNGREAKVRTEGLLSR